jgi:hypothetical protein
MLFPVFRFFGLFSSLSLQPAPEKYEITLMVGKINKVILRLLKRKENIYTDDITN